LLILRGDPSKLLPRIVREADVGYVAWNRRYDAAAIELDTSLKATLTDSSIEVESFNANLLNEPWQVTTKADGPFKVFTPYWRAVRERGEPSAPLPTPRQLNKARLPATLRQQTLAISDLELEPTAPDWAGGLREAWTPGEDGARERLGTFLDETIDGYREARDLPDRLSTSRLSPHLRFGEISPRQIWHATKAALEAGDTPARPRMSRNSSARSAGASSPTTCSSTIRASPASTMTAASTRCPGRRTKPV
jgi:deoxyribodipyrimidine photo-lyase